METGPARRSPLCVYNGGFLTNRRVRRILSLAGYDLRLGLPGPDIPVGVWGHSPTAHRGEAMAARRNAHLIRIEDAFLRSLRPGRAGDAPMGLCIDQRGVYFDGSQPSDLEHLLKTAPFDDTALLNRARDGIDRLKAADISKYSAFDTDIALPDPGYVLVIDQTRGDASIRLGGATDAHFKEMLYWARTENPGARILIKTHPETQQGFRPGHFSPDDLDANTAFMSDPVSPWQLMDGAIAVYTVTSQLGFEAIMAGHRPVVLGQPFYAGWGLSDDRNPIDRRQRKLTRAQLFAGAMIEYPIWYDPYDDRLGRFEDALSALEAMARCWREDRHGYHAVEMRLWKRAPLQKFLGRHQRIRFRRAGQVSGGKPADGRRVAVWAGLIGAFGAEPPTGLIRIEDGFLRSRGLGATLIPPLSLVLDDRGIYYDPSAPSRLEGLIAASATLSEGALRRAEALRHEIIRRHVSKYNLGGDLPVLPSGERILVPGQVEDDASILTGAGEVRTNLDLLRAARAANPAATLIYKPHPDVEAGLRAGYVPADRAMEYADIIAGHADPVALIGQVDAVWTMTSLLGFEALLRGKPVTVLGTPFYAGWGLTRDLGPVPARRGVDVPLDGLVHAALIAYPRYYDPVSNLPCPPEVALARLATGDIPAPGSVNRMLSKAQGLFASQSWLWR